MNPRKPLFFAMAVTALAALAPSFPSQAQSTVDDQQQLLAQLQSDRRAVVLKSMALDDAQVAAFTPVYDAYQAERKKLADRAVALIDTYASNYDSMSDDAAKGILKDWLAIRDDENQLTRDYAKRMAKVLPSVKVLRFVQIENKIDALLRIPAVRTIPLAQ
jgi:hypothetical protein